MLSRQEGLGVGFTPPLETRNAMTATDGTCGGEDYSRLIRQLCALLVTIVSPSSVAAPGRTPRSPPSAPAMSPAAAASMLLGASMALMLCGSVTFAIGFLLMPWVVGLALLFGFAGAVSTLSSGVFGKPALPSRCKEVRSGLLLTDKPTTRFVYAGSIAAA